MSAPLDLLANFAPFWLAGALAVTIYGAFAKRRRLALLLIGVLGVIAAATLISPELTRPIPRVPPGAHTLKLIQFNAWDETVAPQASAAWIANERPDLVFLEEAEPRIESALLSRGFVRSRGVGHVDIFSRVRPVPAPARLAPTEWRKMPPFARAIFADGTAPYLAIATHLPQPIYAAALPERRMLAAFANRYDRDRLIVAGDLNLTPWSFALSDFDRSLGLRRVDRAEFSWPGHLALGGRQMSALPFLPIDHVYVGAAWRLVSVERGPALGSDHFPIEVVLTDGG